MATDPGINAHIQLGKAWGTLQTLTTTWTVNRYVNINNLAAKLRSMR